jgi:hypothetical protein
MPHGDVGLEYVARADVLQRAGHKPFVLGPGQLGLPGGALPERRRNRCRRGVQAPQYRVQSLRRALLPRVLGREAG